MKKLKIYVYAICKNEEKFVDRWVDSMSEADDIFVLDTGSTDNTVQKLKKRKVNVQTKIIEPWRFDVARNESLKLVPEDADICVCTDLDEVFEKGWRKKLEKAWMEDTTRCRFIYNWSLKDGKPQVSFYYEKTHTRDNYKWVNPVHEILEYQKEKENIITVDEIVLNHYPDNTKSRSSYLPLLELSVKENPNNDRNLHYLGREYMYYHRWNDSIDTLIKHINLPSSTWRAEKSASMRFISRCYINLNRFDEAKFWLNKAIEMSPNQREGYVELAMLEFQNQNYFEVISNCIKALTILKNELIYISEPFCWDSTIDDLLSISYYNLGIKDLALYHINKALEYNPDDERLLKNKEIFEK